MKLRFFTTIAGWLLLSGWLLAQKPVPFKPESNRHVQVTLPEDLSTIRLNPETAKMIRENTKDLSYAKGGPVPQTLQWTPEVLLDPNTQLLRVIRDPQTGLPIWMEGNIDKFSPKSAPVSEQAAQFLTKASRAMQVTAPAEEWRAAGQQEDELGQVHLRYRQYYKGLPVYGSEVILHARNNTVFALNGRYYPTPDLKDTKPGMDGTQAISVALNHLKQFTTVRPLSDWEKKMAALPDHEATLVIFHPDRLPGSERLAWQINAVPNLVNHWLVFVDALTGEVLQSFKETCQLAGHRHPAAANEASPPPDGPASASARDLGNANRSINTYSLGNRFYLIDATRPMYKANESKLPDDPIGAIWTINAGNTSPQQDDFNVEHVTSTNNAWNNPTAVSAHYNAGLAYEYFRTKFNRNAINGTGGTIISIINVAEDDGGAMDNAFWNGAAMFYGNGDQAFRPLALALDVAGHEMSHGVIENTANLEYYGESGAMNESFADVFGVLIDRDDWLIGEDVTKTSYISSGVLRSMQDPHNGGRNLNDNGWQPAHVNEKYNGNQDNAGVHINSGICNKAFYLFATAVGKDKAEQVYYRALDNYLVRSSKFADLRIAIVKAATDLHGANSAEVSAANSAFDQVGITGQGGGEDYQEDVETNTGDNYIIMTDTDESAIYIFTPEGQAIANPLNGVPAPGSQFSATDDGSVIVYVAEDFTLKALLFDWTNGRIQLATLSDETIWRRVAISKTGQRMAALLQQENQGGDNVMLVFDFSTDGTPSQSYLLTNPTTAQGGSNTDEVQYADAMEWDFSGEYVMYDAFNSISKTLGGNIEFWDINFLSAWDNAGSSFGDGRIEKLFSGLPENVTVGNPTFSKNSPYIIAFDYWDEGDPDDPEDDEYFILGANIETGDIGAIAQNNTIGYPNYGTDDKRLIFDTDDDLLSDAGIAMVNLADDKISANEDFSLFIEGGKWGTWFATGARELTDLSDPVATAAFAKVFPNPVRDQLNIQMELTQAENVELRLVNLLGQTVAQRSFQGFNGQNKWQWNLQNVPKGVYWLQLESATRQGILQVSVH